MMTLNEFLLEYGRHPLSGFTPGFREHLDAAVAERVEAAVRQERERCAKICDEYAISFENFGETVAKNAANVCAKRIREADDDDVE